MIGWYDARGSIGSNVPPRPSKTNGSVRVFLEPGVAILDELIHTGESYGDGKKYNAGQQLHRPRGTNLFICFHLFRPILVRIIQCCANKT